MVTQMDMARLVVNCMELQLFQTYRYISQNFIVILSKCLCFTYFHIILTKYATHVLYKIATAYLKAGFHSLGSLKMEH